MENATEIRALKEATRELRRDLSGYVKTSKSQVEAIRTWIDKNDERTDHQADLHKREMDILVDLSRKMDVLQANIRTSDERYESIRAVLQPAIDPSQPATLHVSPIALIQKAYPGFWEGLAAAMSNDTFDALGAAGPADVEEGADDQEEQEEQDELMDNRSSHSDSDEGNVDEMDGDDMQDNPAGEEALSPSPAANDEAPSPSPAANAEDTAPAPALDPQHAPALGFHNLRSHSPSVHSVRSQNGNMDGDDRGEENDRPVSAIYGLVRVLLLMRMFLFMR